MANTTTLEIAGGASFPVGPVKLGIGFTQEGNVSVGIGTKGPGAIFSGSASYNPTTDTWSATLGVGNTVGDYDTLGGKRGGFVGVGLDDNGAYFVVRGFFQFPAGNTATTPLFTGTVLTNKTDLASYEDMRDAFGAAVDYANGLPARAEATLGEFASAAAAAFSLAQTYLSPIVLDMDGDGIELTSLANSHTFFDLNVNGFAEKTGWVTGGDGLLARDLNGNGNIDNNSELFGDNGGTSAYQKLAGLDANADGKVDAADAAFASLRLWQDANGNGRTDAGELKTLAEAGIASLNTASTASNSMNQGHQVAATSTFTFASGATGNAADILFQTDQLNTHFVGDGTAASTQIDPEALFLPLSRGYGELKALHYAFTENATLKAMAFDMLDDAGTALLHTGFGIKAEAFLYEWAGATNINPASRGSYIDARKLAFVEKLVGQDFVNVNGSPNPGSNQANLLMNAWNAAFVHFEKLLLLQGPLSTAIPVRYDFATDELVFTKNLAETLNNVQNAQPADQGAKVFYWQAVGEVLSGFEAKFGVTAAQLQQEIRNAAGDDVSFTVTAYLPGTSGADSITGTAADEYLDGLGGNDTLYGGNGDDFLNGGAGDDVISLPVFGSGSSDFNYGEDTLLGGIGNDTLNGGHGSDLYLINPGDGQDVIGEGIAAGGGEDTLRFGSGISFSELSFARTAPNSDNLLITVGSGSQQIQINQQFNWLDRAIEHFEFADGTVKTAAEIRSLILQQAASSGNDTIYGFQDSDDSFTGGAGNDLLYGLSGNDSLFGGDGADTLHGGFGNNLLDGGDGNDFLKGDFNVDLLYGGYGDDRAFGGDGNDQVFGFLGNDTMDGEAGDDYLAGEDGYDILYGGYGNDTLLGGDGIDNLFGFVGNDSLDGGLDHDYLYGEDGNDTIIGGAGSDTMTGGAGNDKFVFQAKSDSAGSAIDRIVDFTQGVDLIDLSGLGFTGIQAGAGSGTVLGFSSSGGVTTIDAADHSFTVTLTGSFTLTVADFDLV